MKNQPMTSIFKELEHLTAVTFGGFSELYALGGHAVKVLEDQNYLDVLEESYKQNIASEAGLAPTIHAVARQGNNVAVVMDMIDHNEWYHPTETDDVVPVLLGDLDEPEMMLGLKLYCKLLRAGIIHADFHSGNWFINDDSEAIAIDFGLSSELHEAPEAHIKRAVMFLLPPLQQLGYDALAADLYEAWVAGPEVAREELLRVATHIA